MSARYTRCQELGVAILEGVGIDPSTASDLTLHISSDGTPTLTVNFLVEVEDEGKLVRIVSEVRRYTLTLDEGDS